MRNCDKRPLVSVILTVFAAVIICAVFFSCHSDLNTAPKIDTSGKSSETVSSSGTDSEAGADTVPKTEQSPFLTSRAVAIVVNNIEQSLPQFGLSNASVIYECTTEGLVTRLLMVLPDVLSLEDINKIGSIRSVRDCFLELAMSHDAIIAHAGASESAYKMIHEYNIDTLDGVNGYLPPDTFYRDSERLESMAFEHTMMTSGSRLFAGINYLKFRLESTAKKPSCSEKGDIAPAGNAGKVSFSYSLTDRIDYVFDTDSEKYLRYQYCGKPHIDAETGKQLEFDNIVILSCLHTPTGDKENHVSIKLTGKGNGLFFSGGYFEEITWQKDSESSPLLLFHQNGSEIKLKSGKTFVNIVSEEIFNKTEIS